ncbi:hypothetical protein PENANT_c070G08299 [Penicillium antarcticum]|uniref:Major facilitator superfamily (MFS) profile domain-containing protein n=1 Tax=Penicillium antarcticum TaxID=416450 RepID=A0A1V6PPN1_9EURO|nr:hypothetical protein PENANT_c070G08299 [Penicillium antarcticum]
MGFMIKKPDDAPGSAAPAIIIGLFVAFGGVLFGYDTGTISGILAMKYWRKKFSTGYVNPADHYPDVNASQSSMIVSLLSAGTFFGALFAAPMADFFGRRLAMILNTGVFTIGVIMQTIATAIPLFVAGRFFAGLGLAITIGLLLAAIVNNATQDRMDMGLYRIPIAIQFAWAIILVAGMLILPETPRFLVKQDKHKAATKALARLRRLDTNDPAITEELSEIQANHEYESRLGNASYLDIVRGALVYYGTTFFENSGISDGFTVTLITNIINVCSTFPGLWMVEKWGRRNLLMFGAIGMAVCQLIVASVGTALPGDTHANKAMIAFVCIYIFFFACSWGPVAWVVTGELFPLKARAKCLSITTATNWLLNWAIAYATPYMGGFCCICLAFVYFFVYETKGLSLEQVDELYAKVTKAWKSPDFVPSVRFNDVHGLTDESNGDMEKNQSEKATHVESNDV